MILNNCLIFNLRVIIRSKVKIHYLHTPGKHLSFLAEFIIIKLSLETFGSFYSALHYLKYLFILSEGILTLEQVGQPQMISTFTVGSYQTGKSCLWVVWNVSYTHDPKALKNKHSDLIYLLHLFMSKINKSPNWTRFNENNLIWSFDFLFSDGLILILDTLDASGINNTQYSLD